MTTSNDEKIDLDKITREFVYYVDENSTDLSTDPDVIRVKVIKPDGSCERTPIIKSGG